MEAFSIYRYAVPVEVVGAFLYVGGIGYLFRSERAFGITLSAVGLCILAVFTTYPDWGHIPFQARSFPVVRPIIPDHALVIDSENYPMSYVATTGGPSVRFVDVGFNYLVPSSSPLTKLVNDTISEWDGPIDVLGTRTGGQTALDMLRSEYRIVTTSNCQIIKSAWDDDALQLCQAYREQGGKNFQPAVALSFGGTSTNLGLMGPGWSKPEPWGAWSLGSDAVILIPLNPLNERHLLLTVTCRGFASGSTGRRVDVYANNYLVGIWTLTDSATAFEADIPPITGNARLIVRFHISNPVSPSDLHLSNDTRKLGIGLEQLMLQGT
jgi:hypothetical protein